MDKDTQARIDAIRAKSQGTVGVKTQPQQKQPQTFKSQFSNVSDEDWNTLFSGDESGDLKNMYFNLMDGKDMAALKTMKNDPKQATAFNYWKKTYAQGKELATYLNTNRNAWDDENEKEKNAMLAKFQQYHTLSQRAALESLGGNTNIDPSKAYDKTIKGSQARTDEYANRYIYNNKTHQLMKYQDFQEINQDIKRGESFYFNLKLEKDGMLSDKATAGAGWAAGAGAAFTAGAVATSWSGPGAIVGGLVTMAVAGIGGYALTDEADERLTTKHEGYTSYLKTVNGKPPALKSKLNLLLGDWATTSLKLNSPESKGKFGTATEHNNNILNSYSYVQDIIKEGFKSKDKNIQAQTKDLYNQLSQYKEKGDWPGKVKLLQSSTFRQNVEKLIADPAYSYYSKVSLYYKHKDTFAEPKYIDGSKLESYAKEKGIDVSTAQGYRAARLNKEIGMALDKQMERRTIDKNIKDKYRKELSDSDIGEVSSWFKPDGLADVFNKGMFDKGGNPVSFQKWYSSLPTEGTKSSLYTNAVKSFEKTMKEVKQKAAPGSIAGTEVGLRNDLLAKMKDKNAVNEINAYYSIYGANYRKSRNSGDYIYTTERIPGMTKFKEGQNYQDLEKAYNNYKGAYKSKWDNFSETQYYANASQTAGLTARGNYELIDGNINLQRDVPKSVNAANLIRYISKKTEKENQGIYVKQGKWEFNESIKDYEGEESAKSSTISNFFKNQDKTTYDLTYVNTIRDSGQALYMFTDKKTKKTLSVVMPKSEAKSMGEQFASNEYNDDDDKWYDMTGRENLKWYGSEDKKLMPYTRDSYIYNDAAGNKVLFTRVTNPETGAEEEKDIYLGPGSYMTIDQAVQNSMQFLKEYNNQFK
jgi:hypothetical protein